LLDLIMLVLLAITATFLSNNLSIYRLVLSDPGIIF
jgi:hypothetical protein